MHPIINKCLFLSYAYSPLTISNTLYYYPIVCTRDQTAVGFPAASLFYLCFFPILPFLWFWRFEPTSVSSTAKDITSLPRILYANFYSKFTLSRRNHLNYAIPKHFDDRQGQRPIVLLRTSLRTRRTPLFRGKACHYFNLLVKIIPFESPNMSKISYMYIQFLVQPLLNKNTGTQSYGHNPDKKQ